MTYMRRQQNIQPQGFYNPWMPGPDIGRGVQGFIDRMQQQKMYQEKMGQQQWERGITERRTAAYEEQVKPTEPRIPEFKQRIQELMDANPGMTEGQAANQILKYKEPEIIPPVIAKDLERKLVEDYGENWRGEISYDLFRDELDEWQSVSRQKVPKPSTQTAFDKKREMLGERLTAGEITKGEHDKSLLGIAIKKSDAEMRRESYSARDANIRQVADILKRTSQKYKNNPEKEMRKMVRDVPGALPTAEGIRLDMPRQYNQAILNKKDGVATSDDFAIIEKYDMMFKLFQEDLLGKGILTFKDYLAMPPTPGQETPLAMDKDIDNRFMKMWFDIYKQ